MPAEQAVAPPPETETFDCEMHLRDSSCTVISFEVNLETLYYSVYQVSDRKFMRQNDGDSFFNELGRASVVLLAKWTSQLKVNIKPLYRVHAIPDSFLTL